MIATVPPSPTPQPGVDQPLHRRQAGLAETTPPSPTLVSDKPKKNNALRLIILSVLFIVLLAITGYYFFMRSRQTMLINSYETCTAAPGSKIQESYPATCVTEDGRSFTQPLTDEQKQNLEPPVDTSTWKTYSNNSFGFSLTYPSDWDIQELHSPAPAGTSGVQPTIDTIIFATASSYIKVFSGAHIDTTFPQEMLITTEQTMLDEKLVTEDTYILDSQHQDTKIIKIVIPDEKIYRIEAFFPTTNTHRINQMLSTFKFIVPMTQTGQMCGGIAGIMCPAGYSCQMAGNYPDASGTCIKKGTYTCPSSGYVDCMPVMDDAKKKACAPEALTWYKANCPNFQGGAF